MNHPYRTLPVTEGATPNIPLTAREAAEVEEIRARSTLILARAKLVEEICVGLVEAKEKLTGSYWYSVHVDTLRKMYETVMTDDPVTGSTP